MTGSASPDPEELRHSPSTDPHQHVRAEVRWLKAALGLHLRRLQRRGVVPKSDDLAAGVAIKPVELDARLHREEMPAPQPLSDDERAAASRLGEAEIARRELAALDVPQPLDTLRRAYELSDPEYVVLLAGIAWEVDPDIARLCGFLNDHFDRQYPSGALVGAFLDDLGPAPVEIRHVLRANGPLRRDRLISLPAKHGVSVLHAPLVVAPRIVRYVLGDDTMDEALAVACRLTERQVDERKIVLSAQQEKALDVARVRLDDARDEPRALPMFVFRGLPGSGRHRWTRALGDVLGAPVLAVDMPALAQELDTLRSGLREVAREARLRGAVICLEGWERLVEPAGLEELAARRHSARDALVSHATRDLASVLGGHPGAVTLIVESREVPLPEGARELLVLDVPMPDAEAACRLWARWLPKRMRAPGAEAKQLARDFVLTPGGIERAARDASEEALRADRRGQVTRRDIEVAVRAQTRHRLADNATLVEHSHRWDDLVVSSQVRTQLLELVSRHRHRRQVVESGWGRRFGHQLGLSCLFDGPPGTGKTMAASIVAAELGLELYQIDLSRVVDRYIGETEKNLARVFDEAERSGAMLLFDEADSLFAKRTDVKSSNDRFANLEVNYLLQRVEHFDGIAILTTNFPAGLDPAFARRLSLRVTFPRPEAPERARLWQSMLASGGAVHESVNPRSLAEEFEMCGGHIKNAVLRAVFLALAREQPVDHELLRIAARIELKEQGMVVQGDPLADLARRGGVGE